MKTVGINKSKIRRKEGSPIIEGRLTRSGIIVVESDWIRVIGERLYWRLLETLKVQADVRSGRRVIHFETDLYRRVEHNGVMYVQLARGLAPILNGRGLLYTSYAITEGKEIIKIPNPGIKLKKDQEPIFEYVFNHLTQDSFELRAGTLVLETGLGKTYIGGKMIEELSTRTLVIVPMTSNTEDWREALAHTGFDVCVYPQERRVGCDVYIMTIHSALSTVFSMDMQIAGVSGQIDAASLPSMIHIKKHMRSAITPGDFFSQFGFVILDEIPAYATKMWSEIFWRVSAPHMLGLTATPNDRANKMDPVYRMHTGPLLRQEDIDSLWDERGRLINEIIFKGRVKVIKYYGPATHTKELRSKTGTMSFMRMSNQLAEDLARNIVVLREVERLRREGHNVFVFCNTRLHVETLYKLYHTRTPFTSSAVRTPIADGDEKDKDEDGDEKFEGGSENEIMILMGGSGRQKLVDAKREGELIFITFSYGGRGLSIIQMDAIVFASMRVKIHQILGRICRRGHSDPSKIREVVDIIDCRTSLRNQFNHRREEYRRRNWELYKISPVYHNDVVESDEHDPRKDPI